MSWQNEVRQQLEQQSATLKDREAMLNVQEQDLAARMQSLEEERAQDVFARTLARELVSAQVEQQAQTQKQAAGAVSPTTPNFSPAVLILFGVAAVALIIAMAGSR